MSEEIMSEETMAEEKKPRRRIPVEEKKAKLNATIAYHEDAIAKLRKQLADLDKPPVTMKNVSDKIKELGIAPEDVMKALDKMAAKK